MKNKKDVINDVVFKGVIVEILKNENKKKRQTVRVYDSFQQKRGKSYNNIARCRNFGQVVILRVFVVVNLK